MAKFSSVLPSTIADTAESSGLASPCENRLHQTVAFMLGRSVACVNLLLNSLRNDFAIEPHLRNLATLNLTNRSLAKLTLCNSTTLVKTVTERSLPS